jgi:hypothetical protein
MLIGRHFLEYTERVRVKFRGPSVGVFLQHVALQIGYGEAECSALDSDAKRLREKAGDVRGSVRSDINMLLADLWRNRPGSIFGQIPLRCEANPQDIIAKCNDLKEHSRVTKFYPIRKRFAEIWVSWFTGDLPGLGLLLA